MAIKPSTTPAPYPKKTLSKPSKNSTTSGYWLTRTYTPNASRDGAGWKDDRVPSPNEADRSLSEASPKEIGNCQELEALEAKLAKQHEDALKQQQERDKLDTELQTLRQQLAEIREQSQQQPDPHDYTEAETRHYLIDLDLKRAEWSLDQKRDREYKVTGMRVLATFGELRWEIG